MNETSPTNRLLFGTNLFLFITGTLIVAASLGAELLGLDITPGFGMIQMIQLLIGLTLLTLAGYLQIYALRDPHTPRSLQADIGVRLGATGLVFTYVSGLSDLMGIGTHIQPSFERPFVGPLQLGGIGVGIILITVGMLLYYTSRGNRDSSSLEFLLDKSEKSAAKPAS
ncbi:MAG: hypothetical protein KDE51_07555 [Anaerolineales bacterium]|nr:hypothetical protein [Anaerolineales bacterium]